MAFLRAPSPGRWMAPTHQRRVFVSKLPRRPHGYIDRVTGRLEIARSRVRSKVWFFTDRLRHDVSLMKVRTS